MKMEKRGVIKAGVTPPVEQAEPVSKSQEKRATIQQLDDDFRKRAAEAASK
jgi:hypothetical protein